MMTTMTTMKMMITKERTLTVRVGGLGLGYG